MTAVQLRALFLDLHLSSELGAFLSKVSARLFKWAHVDVKKIEAQVKAERKARAEQLIRWDEKGTTGKAAGGKHLYRIKQEGKSWSWERPGSGVGCGYSGGYKTRVEAQAGAEENERDFGGAGKKAHRA
jgi:regulator of protease activity HflC (stomatin/prohibitin superfamily)